MIPMRVTGHQNATAVVKDITAKNGIALSDDGLKKISNDIIDRIMIGPTGAVTFSTDSGERDVLEYISALAADPASEHLFSIESVNSDDTPIGQNPWSRDYWNVTAQHRMQRDNPALAAKMQNAVAIAKHGDNAGDPANPWSRLGFNITAQMQIMKTDPQRAARLERQANQ
jgi:hypothetical protein